MLGYFILATMNWRAELFTELCTPAVALRNLALDGTKATKLFSKLNALFALGQDNQTVP